METNKNMQFHTYCNLDEEERCGYKISAKMKQVWNIQLNMLLELKRICDKHELTFTLDFGSLLGAVRHKGLIPWDDDIDVSMARADYDKLVKIMPGELNENYFFQCAYTEKGYFRGHAQLRCNNTTMILPVDATEGRSFHQGIFIDIFPRDYVSADINERKDLYDKGNLILRYLWCRSNKRERLLYNFKHYKQQLGEDAKLNDLGLFKKFEDLFRQTKKSETPLVATLSSGFYHDNVTCNDAWFDEVIELPFENIMVPVPKKYHEILSREYGDYMTPVKAPNSHGTTIINTEKSYTEELPKLRLSYLKIYYIVALSKIKRLLNK